MTIDNVDDVYTLAALLDQKSHYMATQLRKDMKADIIKRDTRLSKNERNRRLTNLLP